MWPNPRRLCRNAFSQYRFSSYAGKTYRQPVNSRHRVFDAEFCKAVSGNQTLDSRVVKLANNTKTRRHLWQSLTEVDDRSTGQLYNATPNTNRHHRGPTAAEAMGYRWCTMLSRRYRWTEDTGRSRRGRQGPAKLARRWNQLCASLMVAPPGSSPRRKRGDIAHMQAACKLPVFCPEPLANGHTLLCTYTLATCFSVRCATAKTLHRLLKISLLFSCAPPTLFVVGNNYKSPNSTLASCATRYSRTAIAPSYILDT